MARIEFWALAVQTHARWVVGAGGTKADAETAAGQARKMWPGDCLAVPLPLTPMRVWTVEEARRAIRRVGLKASRNDGEWEIRGRGGEVYFTEDIADAVYTAWEMARV